MTPTYQPKALTPEQLIALAQELKQALMTLYGERLDRLVLYGSYARGDYHAESDVDFLVVLRDEPVKEGSEVWTMGNILTNLSDKYDTLIMAKPTSTKKSVFSTSFLYEEIRREGKII